MDNIGWLNIVLTVLAGLGGVSGLISLYQAKANKTALDIANFSSLIEEERKERHLLREEYESYKQQVTSRVDEVKIEVMQMREQNHRMQAAIFSAFRCKYPEAIESCIVWKNWNKLDCNGCVNNLSEMDFIKPDVSDEAE